MQLQEPECYKRQCIHFIGVKTIEEETEEHPEIDVNYCEAFPAGIPDDIAYGDNLHLKPVDNQGNDIVYEKG